jgi:hypothetical protein
MTKLYGTWGNIAFTASVGIAVVALQQNLYYLWIAVAILFSISVFFFVRAYFIVKSETKLSWIEKYQKGNHGRLPPLPDFLIPIVNKYTKGEPISKNLEIITMSGQFWNRLLPTQKDELKEFIEWSGQDFRDYIARMESMLPPKPFF